MLLVSRKNLLVPKKIFFTKGVGTHKAELRSFELALRDAGIEKCNLVKVSSIFPPECKVISRNEGLRELYAGMMTFTVISRCFANEPHRLIAASIGCAVPADPNAHGYLSEQHAIGQNDKIAGDHAEDLAVEKMAS
ncbi:MAG: arginine decarboxylase, pyruvoyl-dependent, partial [Candidatus Omnitrophica bacterium]|nr:arginine decarboxylase, pyruvoyl-dependent [Candidatus Omnitrophota bacterium]